MTTRRVASIAAVAMLATAAHARGEWIMVQPPIAGEKNYECLYDTSAPVTQWGDAFGRRFETAAACEEMLAEYIRRSTAPGRRERLIAQARQRDKEDAAADKTWRRDHRGDPESRFLRRMMGRRRDPRICSSGIESWTNARCIERLN